MREVGAFEAKNKLAERLDKVEIVDREKARATAAAIRILRRSAKLDGISLKELIEEGRR